MGSWSSWSTGKTIVVKNVSIKIFKKDSASNYFSKTTTLAFLILLRSNLIKVITVITRQCLMDDYFGVGESLEEQAFGQGLVARGSQLLVRLVQLRIRLRLRLD